jgi:hypothetical protein
MILGPYVAFQRIKPNIIKKMEKKNLFDVIHGFHHEQAKNFELIRCQCNNHRNPSIHQNFKKSLNKNGIQWCDLKKNISGMKIKLKIIPV